MARRSVILFAIAAGLVFVLASCSPGSGILDHQEQMRRAGLDYYRENYGPEDVEAVVEDFGCHREIHVYRNGELVRRLHYRNGEVYERSR